jgi:hypothetical protein
LIRPHRFNQRAFPFFQAIVMAAVFSVTHARGQGNYQSSPLGGHSAVMGGTGVTLGVDGAAPFLNPATLAQVEGHTLAFAARFFRYSQLQLRNWHRPGPTASVFGPLEFEPRTLRTREIHMLPDTTCLFFDLSGTAQRVQVGESLAGTHTLAFCLAKTEETEFSSEAINFSTSAGPTRIDQGQGIEHDFGLRKFGPSWAYRLSEDVAAGGSLILVRASYDRASHSVMIVDDPTAASPITAVLTEAVDAYAWSVLAHAGVTYAISKVFSLGASVRTPNLHLLGGFEANYSNSFSSDTSTTNLSLADGEFRMRVPWKFSLGLGAEWNRLRGEVDAFFYPAVSEYARVDADLNETTASGGSPVSRSERKLTLVENADSVLNFGVGAEYFVASALSVAVGLGTDMSALPALRAGAPTDSLFRSRSDAYRASVGLISYSAFGDLLIGLRADYERGQMAAMNQFAVPADLAIIDFRAQSVMLIVAGRVSLRTVANAASDLKNVVEGDAPPPLPRPRDPLPQPARP